MPATIKDVARLAKVSISTVSRVTNGAENVSPAVKKRVLKAVKALKDVYKRQGAGRNKNSVHGNGPFEKGPLRGSEAAR